MIGIFKQTHCFYLQWIFFFSSVMSQKCLGAVYLIKAFKIHRNGDPCKEFDKVIDKNSEMHSRSLSKEVIIMSLKNLWLHLNDNKLNIRCNVMFLVIIIVSEL